MWTISLLKQNAWNSLKDYYWMAFVVCLLNMLIIGMDKVVAIVNLETKEILSLSDTEINKILEYDYNKDLIYIIKSDNYDSKKLDLYLKLIIKFIESEDSGDGESLREALNDLTRYKNIIAYKYRKYLDEKYLKLLLKKISILEYELNSKLVYKDLTYEEEAINHRRR
mgnify:CR=1 FL=1